MGLDEEGRFEFKRRFALGDNKMQLVTLAHLTLHRAGSASRRGMVHPNDITGIFEIADAHPETLRSLMLNIAEKHGDSSESLQQMRQSADYDHKQRQVTIFNIQTGNTQYSCPYATCYAFPALKINERYFKLEETAPPNIAP